MLNYQEDQDYLSQEVLNNIANYFDVIAVKMDKFRKEQQDNQLRYEVEKAKAADQNDEDLDKIGEQLEVRL